MNKNQRDLDGIKYHLEQAGIMEYLNDPNVTEVMLNPDGQVWIEAFGKPMFYARDIDAEKSVRILNALGDYHGQVLTSTSPILECEIPTDGSRFEGLIPPIVAKPSFVIRKKATKIFTFDDYIASGTMDEAQAHVLTKFIRKHKNIVVVGGTGSGKTTLVNALLDKMTEEFQHERFVILEDTNEIQCKAKNHVVKRTNQTANVTMQTLLRTTLRYRPDRIIVGEVRGGEALDLLKAWNTGHPGGLATIHADSAFQGLSRFEQCVNEVLPTVNQLLIANTVHVLVFIKRTEKGRRIEEILEVSGFENGRYITYPALID
ncbi:MULTISPECIES: P-type conjugative transfer ATPase TrbB [Vibrio]|uniref:P-type conjugative transfer ATPase TrbB n=1 Tax=Vibrio TaxID=662 RepID=UPI0002E3E573|nr:MULTISPECIES: P-type conjugative transfer ATPase TrbB [Vibrio]EKO3821477.1 P-type conjugative transfer ATPase TrbB [Vibrio harveyi]GBK99880.1 hypothetical protein VH1709_contig00039-0036 [Vibrio harveyi]